MKNIRLFPPSLGKTGKRMSRRIVTLMVSLLLLLPSIVYAQAKISVVVAEGSLTDAFSAIQRSTDYRFLYSTEDVNGIGIARREFTDTDIQEVLGTLLAGSGLTWQISNNVISVRQANAARRQAPPTVISGRVVDQAGNPLPGVSVVLKGTTRGTATDARGNFSINRISAQENTLIFSFVGKKTVEMPMREGAEMDVVMEEQTTRVDEVIITGLYTRERESFTGSAATFSRSELQRVGNRNMLQSLRTLDPSFAIIENNEFGSDPNRLPDLEIRGKTSVVGLTEEYGRNPNQPLFILDGFETTLQTISDLSMDMVESITVLKDAASTAIYGSKAANGVIVVQTRDPEIGQLRVNYKGDFSLSFPDLSDYNLMNAREKLEFERLSWGWGPIDEQGNLINQDRYAEYMNMQKEVERGVNTYWLHLPVRTAFTNRHNLYVEGGTPEVRYGIGVNYGNTMGVMKGSDREMMGVNFKLMYRRGSFSFKNILTVDNVNADRENVPFSRFAMMNPYFRRTDANGETPKTYTVRRYNSDYLYSNAYWDMTQNNIDRTTTFAFSNSTELEWRISDELRVRGRFGVGKSAEKRIVFVSPFHTSFIGRPIEETGTYRQSNDDFYNYNGDASITYGKLIGDVHRVNAVAGFNFREENGVTARHMVTGFIDDEYPNPNFALGYPYGTRPTYFDLKRRAANYYFNGHYSYRDRYLLDVTFRLDGTSIFGVNKHFTETWSVGLAWNIHNESFMEKLSEVNRLRLRASIGNPGNQNFDDYISMMVYGYNPSNPNVFGPSMVITDFGDPNLDWQKTLDKNIGLDLEMLDSRLKLSVDVFHKNTDPLLVYIGLPSSTGVSRKPRNFGRQISKGVTAAANYQVISNNDITLAVNANMRSIKSHYAGIGNRLDKFNEDNQGLSYSRYYDGGSPNDLWAVRSLGIDPATGREIFLKKDGTTTFLYDYKDEVVVGNTEPDVEGVLGMYFRYKNLSASFNFRLRLGGQAVMTALYDKVERIFDSSAGLDNRFANLDRRALHDRWKNPGDQAKFKAIWITGEGQYRPSSRFVMDNDVLAGESINLSYETYGAWLRTIGASSLTFSAYMNDIFRLSTIKNERGISYPFARSISFSVGLRF